MIKMEGIVTGIILLHFIFMFVILWRTEISVHLLKELLNATVQETEKKEYDDILTNRRDDLYQVEEDEGIIINPEEDNIELQEKEKLINEVLSEIFS